MMPDPREVFPRLLGRELVEVVRVYGGGNSQVFRLQDAGGNSWCGKVYASPVPGRRDRMATEWAALVFLHDNEICSVPRPIACHSRHNIAVYEWIEGTKVAGRVVTEREVNLAVDFLAELGSLREAAEAADLPPASEACFTLDALERQLSARAEGLLGLTASDSVFQEMREFVGGELVAARNGSMARAQKWYEHSGHSGSQDLPFVERILSPSDFGFHNAIAASNGFVWLDFEYFGWDDPAKTMADFVLHPNPAMDIGFDTRRKFWQGMIARFGNMNDLAERARWLYPLFGMKWCLIVLNEFLRHGIERRLQASGEVVSTVELLRRQLAKARQILKTVMEHDESFPY